MDGIARIKMNTTMLDVGQKLENYNLHFKPIQSKMKPKVKFKVLTQKLSISSSNKKT